LPAVGDNRVSEPRRGSTRRHPAAFSFPSDDGHIPFASTFYANCMGLN